MLVHHHFKLQWVYAHRSGVVSQRLDEIIYTSINSGRFLPYVGSEVVSLFIDCQGLTVAWTLRNGSGHQVEWFDVLALVENFEFCLLNVPSCTTNYLLVDTRDFDR